MRTSTICKIGLQNSRDIPWRKRCECMGTFKSTVCLAGNLLKENLGMWNIGTWCGRKCLTCCKLHTHCLSMFVWHTNKLISHRAIFYRLSVTMYTNFNVHYHSQTTMYMNRDKSPMHANHIIAQTAPTTMAYTQTTMHTPNCNAHANCNTDCKVQCIQTYIVYNTCYCTKILNVIELQYMRTTMPTNHNAHTIMHANHMMA